MNNQYIEYYLSLFDGLRDRVNTILYPSENLKVINSITKEDLKKFSLMIMVCDSGDENYRWLLLDDQKEYVINKLTKQDWLKKIKMTANDFFDLWINFHLSNSGLVKYFTQTDKDTEYIVDFSKEKNLVSKGYEADYKEQKKFSELRKDYRKKIYKKFDPFVELETIWGFSGVSFYYIKLPKIDKLSFIAVFPILTSDEKSFLDRANFIFSLIKNAVLGANLMKEVMDQNVKKLNYSLLKTAIISILIDSYAHNISAHSLAALKWWIELRYKIMDKRFSVPASLLKLNPHSYFLDADKTKVTTKKYYEALGLTDSSYDEGFYSLYDFLQFADQDTSHKLLSFTEKVKLLGKDSSGKIKEKNEFNPRFPVPIDYALYPFFRFLRDKGAFWSGVTRDMAFGGESKTWYKILWEDFANNPLYLGTIAKTEGITKINIYLAVKLDTGEWINGRFVTIDLSVIDYEEKIVRNPELKIQYSTDDYERVKNYINTTKKDIKKSICKKILGQTNCDDNILQKILEELGKTKESYKNRDDIEGRFPTQINNHNLNSKKLLEVLDDIVKEIYLSNDINENSECIVEKNESHILNEECNQSINKQVKNSNYSKYAFVKLGKCFKHFREILNKENYEVFLPGGLVGEHALFTIFENTIRNIKHYKNSINEIKQTGINFWIAIEKKKIIESSSENELFKIQTWLMHETDLYDNNENKTLWQRVTDRTIERILDDNGVPKMGGNSQDKACSAMLFNNEFKSVENTESERDKIYFPWINFHTVTEVNKFNFNSGEPENSPNYYKLSNLDDKKDFLCEYEKKINNKKGYLKKSFYMWQAADYFIIEDKKQLEMENISRFRFVILSDKLKEEIKKDVINIARDKGIVRLLDNYETNNITNKKRNEKLKLLFITWLNTIWLKNSIIGLNLYKDNCLRSVYIENNQLISYPNQKFNEGINIFLSHGGGDEVGSCNVRSHGAFWNKYFSKVESKQPKDLENDYAIDNDNDYLLLDLLEVICTKIVIFDDRINNRFIPLGDTKRKKVFEEQLQLFISGEVSPNKGEIKYGFFKNILNNLCIDPHILIVHLSYIESLGYVEENINTFIENEIKDYFERDNFILIITTGRGRGTWRGKLNEEYKLQTMFKPVESLLNAVESGISYNDNFDVKHNLIKVIFGS